MRDVNKDVISNTHLGVMLYNAHFCWGEVGGKGSV